MFDRFLAVTNSVFVQYIWPVIKMFLTGIGKEVLLSALSAVTKANNQVNMNNSQKRDYAADLIRQDVDNASSKAINLAIEIAVSRLNQ